MTKRRFRPANTTRNSGGAKVNGRTYYTCDYTNAIVNPDRAAHMPRKNPRGKWIKTGHYVNWEAALSHLIDKYCPEDMDREQYLCYLHEYAHDNEELMERTSSTHVFNTAASIMKRMEYLAGRSLKCSPSWDTLACFGGDMQWVDFLSHCRCRSDKVRGLAILPQTTMQEDIEPVNLWPDYIEKERAHEATAFTLDACSLACDHPPEVRTTHSFIPIAKTSRRVRGETAYAHYRVFHAEDESLPYNPLASQMFQTKMHGYAYVFAIGKDGEFIDTTLAHFLHVHGVKQRRKRARGTDNVQTTSEYKSTFDEMAKAVREHSDSLVSQLDISATKRMKVSNDLSVVREATVVA